MKRTIKTLAASGVVQPQSVDEHDKDAMGRTRITQAYHVGERDSYVIVAQLSPEFTAKLVDRWRALESGEATPLGHAPGFDDLRKQMDELKAENARLQVDVQDAEWLTIRRFDAVENLGQSKSMQGRGQDPSKTL